MKKTEGGVDKGGANSFTYGSIIHLYLNEGLHDKATYLFEEMNRKNIFCGIEVYNLFLWNYAKVIITLLVFILLSREESFVNQKHFSKNF